MKTDPCVDAAERHDERGFTLAEMLVALFIVSVALLALLGVFGTTAKSLQSQAARAEGVRVAVDTNESFRNQAYTAVPTGTLPSTTVVRDGRTYTVATTVTEADAATLGAASGTARVKRVVTVVSWTVRGQTKSVRYETVLAPTSAVAPVVVSSPAASAAPSPSPVASSAYSIVSVTLSPQPLIVAVPSGVANDDLLVTVALSGYSTTDTVQIAWTNDGATSMTRALVNAGGQNWTTTIPKADIVHATASGSTSSMNFVVTTGKGQTRTTTLTTQGQVASPPELTATTITPGVIVLNNNGANKGQNDAAVTFTAHVSGLSATSTTDSVKVSYAGKDGAAKEIALTRSTTDATKWEHTFAHKSEWFAAGTDQAFTFTVRRASDGATDSEIKKITVRY